MPAARRGKPVDLSHSELVALNRVAPRHIDRGRFIRAAVLAGIARALENPTPVERPPKQTRNTTVLFYLTREQRGDMNAAARLRGLKVPDFIRLSIAHAIANVPDTPESHPSPNTSE